MLMEENTSSYIIEYMDGSEIPNGCMKPVVNNGIFSIIRTTLVEIWAIYNDISRRLGFRPKGSEQ